MLQQVDKMKDPVRMHMSVPAAMQSLRSGSFLGTRRNATCGSSRELSYTAGHTLLALRKHVKLVWYFTQPSPGWLMCLENLLPIAGRLLKGSIHAAVSCKARELSVSCAVCYLPTRFLAVVIQLQ